MTLLDDLNQAMNDYPETSVDLAIVNVDVPGVALNPNDEGTFQIQLTNRGPLLMTDVLFKVVGKRGTLVKGTGAIQTFASENIFGLTADVPAHNTANPYIVNAQFKVTRATSSVQDLFEVTLHQWNASLDHILINHSDATDADPSDDPIATYSAQVVAV